MAFVMIFLWVPETKQRTLEELDYICKSLYVGYGEKGINAWPSWCAHPQAHAISDHRGHTLGFSAIHPVEGRRLAPPVQIPTVILIAFFVWRSREGKWKWVFSLLRNG